MRAGVRAGEHTMQLRILTTALALSLPSVAFAQSEDATDLDRVIVTGTRTAVTVDQSLSAVDVIDRDEIERSKRIRCRSCCAVAPASTWSTRAASAS
jgi:outer membrane cobalamin receptor